MNVTPNKNILLTLSLLFLVFSLAAVPNALAKEADENDSIATVSLDWKQLTDLPDPNNPSDPLGVAGPFVGVHNEALIVAGGANFPRPVWDEESKKVWHDKIHVLTREELYNL